MAEFISIDSSAARIFDSPYAALPSDKDNVAQTRAHRSPGTHSLSNKIAAEARDRVMAEIDKGEDFDNQISAPELRTSLSQRTLTKDARLLQLLAQFNAISGDNHQTTLVNALTTLMVKTEARRQQFNDMASRYEKASEVLKEAQDQLEVAIEDLEAKQAVYDKAVSKLNQAVTELQRLRDSGMAESDPEFMAAVKKVENAVHHENHAKTDLGSSKLHAKEAADKSTKLMDSHATLLDEMTILTANSRGKTVLALSAMSISQEQSLTIAGRMALLLSKLITLLNEGNATRLKNDLAINQARLESTRKSMLQKAAEYEEQVRKAEKAAKTGNCVSKIMGALATVVGVVATVFSGGVGVTLMAVGIGLLVLDEVLKATTGKTLTERIMNPLMEHILNPLMKAIGNIVNEFFDRTPIGLVLNAIDKATGANMMDSIHQAVTAISAVTLIVAVALLLRSAMTTVTGQVSKLLTDTVIQRVKDAIVGALKKLPEMLKASIAQNPALKATSIEKLIPGIIRNLPPAAAAYYARITSEVMMVTGSTMRLTYGAISARLAADAEKMMAAMTISEMLTKLLTRHTDDLLDVLKRNDEMTQAMQLELNNLQTQNNRTALYVAKHIRA